MPKKDPVSTRPLLDKLGVKDGHRVVVSALREVVRFSDTHTAEKFVIPKAQR